MSFAQEADETIDIDLVSGLPRSVAIGPIASLPLLAETKGTPLSSEPDSNLSFVCFSDPSDEDAQMSDEEPCHLALH